MTEFKDRVGSFAAVLEVVAGYGGQVELDVDYVDDTTDVVVGDVQGCDSLGSLLQDFRVAFVKYFQHIVALLCGCFVFEEESHVGEGIVVGVALGIVDVAGHDVVGDVDDAVDMQDFLYAVFPVLEDSFLWFFEAIRLSADEETGAVIVVVGSGEGFEICEVFFDFDEFFLSGLGLQFVLILGLLVRFLALLEIGLWSLSFKHQLQSLSAYCSHLLASLFRFDSEQSQISWAFSSFLLSFLHWDIIVIILLLPAKMSKYLSP